MPIYVRLVKNEKYLGVDKHQLQSAQQSGDARFGTPMDTLPYQRREDRGERKDRKEEPQSCKYDGLEQVRSDELMLLVECRRVRHRWAVRGTSPQKVA